MVFPSADFSRFTHSCGGYHISAMMTKAIGDYLSQSDLQTIRLAALLHDVGHYPFSHTAEIAMKQHYPQIADSPYVPHDGAEPPAHGDGTEVREAVSARDGKPNRGYLNHEDVGEQLILHSPEIREALPDHVAPRDVATLITGDETRFFASIVKSDLDADRLDYLLRDGYFSGLPFGKVDLDYLVSQLWVAEHNGVRRLGFRSKATNAVDHMLMARYFAYQQLVWHKTAAAFEWLMVDVLKQLMASDEDDVRLDFSRDGVIARIRAGKWYELDDGYVLERVARLAERSTGLTREKADAILYRHPPKMVPSCEGFVGLSVAARLKSTWNERMCALLADLESNLDLSRERVTCWRTAFEFVDYLGKAPTPKQERKSVILFRDSGSAYLQTDRLSLMHALSKKRYCIERVYVLPDRSMDERSQQHLVAEVRRRSEIHLRG